jgi:glycosyltransferase involved in cell wall biosynthesis
VTPGSVAELASALETLIASAELRERLGRAARRKVVADADPNTHRERLVALIKQAAERHG